MCWLYVPGLEVLNLESNLPTQQADVFVMSKGKPMSQRALLNAWKKKSWIKHLSGLMLEPSMANLGAERWIASLGDIPANHSLLQEKSKEEMTPDIFGLTSEESLEKSTRPSVSLKMSQTIYEWDLNKSTMTFAAWIMLLRQGCFQRKKLGHHTNANVYSFWPTPNALGGTGYMSGNKRDVWHPTLATAVKMCPVGNPPIITAEQFKNLGKAGVLLQYPLRGGELNPTWVEWLMGLPTGWTGTELLGTAWFHWLQLMRGEFLKIVCNWKAMSYSYLEKHHRSCRATVSISQRNKYEQ
jgi:DNA (cytosine-5)-methyltransferase 1